MRTQLRRSAAVIILVAAAIPAGSAAAASPHVVDPGSLSPGLNPHYAPYDCWRTGAGITCQGDVEDSYGPDVLEWFDCSGTPIYVWGRERQHITRWHDAGGNATKTTLATEFRDVFGLDASGAGPTVSMFSRFTKHYEYLVPGVRDSRVMRTTGASLVARASDGGGVLARETGWIEFAPGLEDEVVTDYRGQKDLLEDFDGFVQRVCAHLTGG